MLPLALAGVALACGARSISAAPNDAAPPDADSHVCDADGDGFAAAECGGDDCDDARADRRPGASDNAGIGTWNAAPIPGTTQLATDSSVALVVEPLGTAHVALAIHGPEDASPAGADGELWIASDAGGAWSMVHLESAGLVRTPKIAMGPAGDLHVAFRMTDSGFPGYATNTTGDWLVETVARDDAGDVGVAVSAGGAVAVAYTAGGAWVPVVATLVAGTWTTERPDPLGAFGPYVDIALGEEGEKHVAYTRLPEHELWYASDRSGEWATERIDPSETPAMSPHLSLDVDGEPAIMYFDQEGYDTVLAKRTGGVWTSAVLNHDESAPGELVIDSEGTYHAMYGGPQNVIWYAVRRYDEWWREEIVPAGWVDLAVGADGEARIVSSVPLEGTFLQAGYDIRRIRPDGVDQNCDGVDGVDFDRDGHASAATGGDDPDDTDPSVP